MFLKLNECLVVITSPHVDLSFVEEHSRILTTKPLEKHQLPSSKVANWR